MSRSIIKSGTSISTFPSQHRISGALNALAPDAAIEIAEVYPFPHLDFFRLAPSRMHLLGLALACSRLDDIDLAQLDAKKWIDAARIVADPAPVGLEGLLSSLSLPIWEADDYRKLWALIECPEAMQTLLHSDLVEPTAVRILYALPPGLRDPAIVRNLRRPLEAAVLGHLCDDTVKCRALIRTIRSAKSRSHF